jgi:hypothetical protein
VGLPQNRDPVAGPWDGSAGPPPPQAAENLDFVTFLQQ